MAGISISQIQDGRWTVQASGLVVTNLTRETAEAFADSYRRISAA